MKISHICVWELVYTRHSLKLRSLDRFLNHKSYNFNRSSANLIMKSWRLAHAEKKSNKGFLPSEFFLSIYIELRSVILQRWQTCKFLLSTVKSGSEWVRNVSQESTTKGQGCQGIKLSSLGQFPLFKNSGHAAFNLILFKEWNTSEKHLFIFLF